jgi:cob(I)alamin adenosyltransferase
MQLYTREGDDGYTRRLGGQELRKCHPQIDAVGAVDELNASIGWALVAASDENQSSVREILEPLQGELFEVCALISAAGPDKKPSVALCDETVTRMERQIDAACDRTGELKGFILPRGCELACRLHLCRTLCRRAERCLGTALESESRIPHLLFRYLNRLSDLLFALAMDANHNVGVAREEWSNGA